MQAELVGSDVQWEEGEDREAGEDGGGLGSEGGDGRRGSGEDHGVDWTRCSE